MKNNFFIDKLTNKKERDNIMVNRLICYVKEINFDNALVIVGQDHFNAISTSIEKEFTFEKLAEPQGL